MMNFMFGVFPIIFFIMFVLILGVFIFAFASGIKTWNKNNNSPRLTVRASVVAKRDELYSHNHRHEMHTHTSHSHSYYATFQFDSGDRLELAVPASEYGLLAEGDTGELTFQGTRYLSFVRQ